MDFDYERDTRKFYQDEATAQRYHAMFMSPSGWRNLPSRVVAQRERRVMRDLLARVPHRSALDIPAGTGKLAGVFASLGTRVVASDISSSMLRQAEAEFARAGHSQVDFRVADAADLGEFANGAFDVVACLRLMHRVPSSLRARMLQEFARVAPWAIVSFGIENGFHALRRRTRAAIFGGQRDTLCFCSLAEARAELVPHFDIMAKTWIAPALSQEMIFLLRSKRTRSDG
ncbi:MAG TPA: class I SAM-dependent methyltransferase [Rhodanobacteraceae bacterium]|jgi:SAM-dependent methyltransferase|nr:class I SAM-dependent methyltransferase [Rhodanobacteraceae bacterium]